MKKAFFFLLCFCMASPLFAQVFENKDSLAKQTVVLTKNVRAVAETTEKASKDLRSKTIVPTDSAKPKYWKVSGILSFNMSATGLVNWAAGGNSNVIGVAAANVTLLYKKNKFAWESNLDTDFGLSYQHKTTYPWRKSNDKINISTKIGYEFATHWFATALGSFNSQYAAGYKYLTASGVEQEEYISNWLAPSYTDLSLGIDWKPNSIFSLYLSPVAGRITTCIDTVLHTKYLPDITGSEVVYKADFGATFKATVNYDKIENFKVLSTLTLFTPYNAKFGNTDVDWDTSISYQFLKVLNVSLNTSLKYYDNVLIANEAGHAAPRVQFKTLLGVGIGYSF